MIEKHIKQRLYKYAKKSSYYGLWSIFINYAVITTAIAFSLFHRSLFIYMLAVIVIASRMRSFENLLHEGAHGNLYKNKTVNKYLAMIFCALPIGSSFEAYRESHMRHHRYFGDISLDPDIIRYRERGLDKNRYFKQKYLRRLLRIVCLIDSIPYIYGTLRHAVYDKKNPLNETFIRLFFYLSLAALFTLLHAWPLVLLYWFLPFFTVFQIIRFLVETGEHGGLYENHNKDTMTRNVFCHPIIQAILYPNNDGYHLIHHLFPSIPYYHLKEAHQILQKSPYYNSLNHCHGYFLKKYPYLKTVFSTM